MKGQISKENEGEGGEKERWKEAVEIYRSS